MSRTRPKLPNWLNTSQWPPKFHAIPREGPWLPPLTKSKRVAVECKKFSYQPVKKILFRFDPFHQKVESIRKFMSYSLTANALETNPTVSVKTDIVCDRSPPTVDITLLSGKKVVLKTENLNDLELLEVYNKYISSTATVKE
jgi:uncharacterized protein YlzI (FlbEa/FlbD family)